MLIRQFPASNEENHTNVTIRAVGNFGVGIPIYIVNLDTSNDDKGKTINHQMHQHDPTLGITIGSVLTMCSIGIFIWFCVRHRICQQKRQQSRSTTNNIVSQNPISLPPIYNTDLHEMQSLILKPTSPTSIPNGNVKHFYVGNEVKKESDEPAITNTPVIQLNENLKTNNGKTDLKTDNLEVSPPNQTIKKSPLQTENGKKIRNGGDRNRIQNDSIEITTPISQSSHSINQTASPLKSKLNGNLPRIIENPQVCKH